jgi:hypothetical protein
MSRLAHVYYDFEYHESSNMSKEEFYHLQENDYEYWHVLCCTAYKVCPVYSYDELINYIGIPEEDITDNILANSVYNLNGHQVIDIIIK